MARIRDVRIVTIRSCHNSDDGEVSETWHITSIVDANQSWNQTRYVRICRNNTKTYCALGLKQTDSKRWYQPNTLHHLNQIDLPTRPELCHLSTWRFTSFKSLSVSVALACSTRNHIKRTEEVVEPYDYIGCWMLCAREMLYKMWMGSILFTFGQPPQRYAWK